MNPRCRPSLLSLMVEVINALVPVSGVVFLAMGFSGLLAVGLGSVFGRDFIAGDREGVAYTGERCADFFGFHPEARDCISAATAHHYDEVVDTRAAVGVLGAVVLTAHYGLRRWSGWPPDSQVIPRGFSSTVGASLFGAASLLLLGVSAIQVWSGSTSGVGAPLSGGLVSAVALLAYATQLSRELTRNG